MTERGCQSAEDVARSPAPISYHFRTTLTTFLGPLPLLINEKVSSMSGHLIRTVNQRNVGMQRIACSARASRSTSAIEGPVTGVGGQGGAGTSGAGWRGGCSSSSSSLLEENVSNNGILCGRSLSQCNSKHNEEREDADRASNTAIWWREISGKIR